MILFLKDYHCPVQRASIYFTNERIDRLMLVSGPRSQTLNIWFTMYITHLPMSLKNGSWLWVRRSVFFTTCQIHSSIFMIIHISMIQGVLAVTIRLKIPLGLWLIHFYIICILFITSVFNVFIAWCLYLFFKFPTVFICIFCLKQTQFFNLGCS